MNVDLESGVPSKFTENTITCLSCGKQFVFSQTVEGRCLRDHIAFADNERRQLLAMAASRGGNSQQPNNIVVQGPTVNMSNQQTTNVVAHSAPMMMFGVRRGGFCHRWRKRLLCVLCLLILAGAGYGVAMAMAHAKANNGGDGGGMTTTHIGGATTTPTTTLPSTRHT